MASVMPAPTLQVQQDLKVTLQEKNSINDMPSISPISSMFSVLPPPSLQDLKVQFQEPITVPPLEKNERRTIFLSNIDQMHNYHVPTAHFFAANPDFPPEVVAERLKMALAKLLVPYDFAAGRLRLNQESDRLEIDCNAAGGGFVAASSEYSLDDLGGLVFSNPGFGQLAVHHLWPDDDKPLCFFQVTSFKCGGFAIGMVTNHILFDGLGAQKFLANLATQAFDDKPLDVIPCNDRHLLAARSPPLAAFPHPEFCIPDPLDSDPDNESLDTKIFKLTSEAVNYMKDKATDTSIISTPRIATTYNVVAALIWRCQALSTNNNKDRVSTFLTSIDLRPRLNPPLPSSYCANAVLFAPVMAKCEDLEKWPFAEVVKAVAEGSRRFTDEYARSVIDHLEINKGKLRPLIEYNVSSWLRLGFDQVVYPWGKPVCSGPLLSFKTVCFLFPDSEGGINALVSLPAKEMEKFEAYFHELFA